MNSGEDFRKIMDYVIRNFGYDTDSSYPFAVCDSMVSHLVDGDLDEVLPSESLRSLSDFERKEVLSLAHQYQGLCFYDGDASNWLDSIESSSQISDEVSTFRVFQNFDFLIQLAKDGGKPLLEQLSKFQECDGFDETSVIEYLRRTFGNDSLLENTLLLMSDNDSMYSIFTAQQKADLLTYPEGTVYFYGEDGPRFTHPLLLSMEIYNRMNREPLHVSSQSVDEVNKIALELKEYFQEDLEFSDVVCEMSDDYHETIRKILNRPARDVVEFQHDFHGDIPHTGWIIDNNPLIQMLETPYHPISTSDDKTINR